MSGSAPSITTAVITVVRNELDVLPAWLAHMRALVDHVYIADHLPVDGTDEYLRAWSRADPAVKVFSYRQHVYDRERIIATLRERVLAETDADWLFILDPDEFLPYTSKEEFQAPLLEPDNGDVVRYMWRNGMPVAPGPITVPIEIHAQERPSTIGKVAISRRVAADPQVVIPRGAHKVDHVVEGELSGVDVGELYHLPFRSMSQAWEKVLHGAINRLRATAKDPGSRNNWHYIPVLNQMVAEPEWASVLRLVIDYGQPARARSKSGAVPLKMVREKFVEVSLALAGAPPAELWPHAGTQPLPTTLPASALGTMEPHRHLVEELMMLNSDGREPIRDALAVTDDGEVVDPADLSKRTFPTLDGGPQKPYSVNDARTALQAAFWDIERVSGTAWGGHIPFQFALNTLLRPRVYVELGVWAGASFYAACQAAARHGYESTAVAVDTWMGDAHAGDAPAEQFEKVRKVLSEQYSDRSGYIRSTFADAVKGFEPGSVDLLHIDGFHTEEAVTEDFETWKHTLSDRGVAIFHDINEFRDDFGVWRFWAKVKEQYPYVEFGHSHGLGLLVVGENSPLREPIAGTDLTLASPEGRELLQVLFGGVGPMSWDYALLQRKSAAELKQVRQARDLAREQRDRARARRDRIRTERDSARDRVADLENSTSWKVTQPLRAASRFKRR